MPSTSKPQARLMAAAAHTKGGFGGVSQSVGKEFNQADTGKKFNKGGSVGSAEQAFENNIAETAANPTSRVKGLAKGGSVKPNWRRW